MKSENYKLAVVIPCWNCSKVVKPMLESIINQTYHDWRLFCVDDQSTDDTSDLLKEYTRKDNRIFTITRNRQPKGAQTCRNIGFEQSIGAEYIIWFDSDDLIAPYCFEQRVAFMDKHPELDFGVFYAKSFKEDLWKSEGEILFGYKYHKTSDLCRFLRRTLPFVGWTNIYRRSSLVEKGLSWDEKLLSLQDSDFNIQSILTGLKYDYDQSGRIDYFWKVNPSSGSITSKISSIEHQDSHLYLLSKIYNSLSSHQKREYQKEIDDYILFFLDKFAKNKDFLMKILKLDFVACRFWLRLRIRAYHILGRRSKTILFPIIFTYRFFYDRDVSRFNNQQLKSLIRLQCEQN